MKIKKKIGESQAIYFKKKKKKLFFKWRTAGCVSSPSVHTAYCASSGLATEAVSCSCFSREHSYALWEDFTFHFQCKGLKMISMLVNGICGLWT